MEIAWNVAQVSIQGRRRVCRWTHGALVLKAEQHFTPKPDVHALQMSQDQDEEVSVRDEKQ